MHQAPLPKEEEAQGGYVSQGKWWVPIGFIGIQNRHKTDTKRGEAPATAAALLAGASPIELPPLLAHTFVANVGCL
jgi:hypothetical protein